MDLEKLVLELFNRVIKLEEKIYESKDTLSINNTTTNKITTDDVSNYICELKQDAFENGVKSIVLKAGDIEKSVGLKNRTAMVVNAMKKSMTTNDVIVSTTDSGYSTTFEVEYFSSDTNNNDEKTNQVDINNFIIKYAPSPENAYIPSGLSVSIGSTYLMVFSNYKCVGVVFKHYEKRGSTANGQSEIYFFDRYYNLFGKWHRMFLGGRRGTRIMYDHLKDIVDQNGEYNYTK